MVLETKVDQLAGNVDLEGRRAVLELLTERFEEEATTPIGRLELADGKKTVVERDLVLMSEWRSKLPQLLDDKSVSR